MKQWHPIFAKLLRPVLEGYYEVMTNVSVGDVPRAADVVLLRRSTNEPPPFRGLWQDLTQWNVLEYKGPSVAARLEHLDLLIELGLGIHRRLGEERQKGGLAALEMSQVSFWYLANSLGQRFLKKATQRLGNLEKWKEGTWLAHTLDRRIFLVSGSQLPVEPDSLPLHVLGIESEEKELETARLIVSRPELWRWFGDVYNSLHEGTFEELAAMGKTRTRRKGLIFRPEVLLQFYGKDEFFRGWKRLLPHMEPEDKQRILKELLSTLTPEEKEEIKRRLD